MFGKKKKAEFNLSLAEVTARLRGFILDSQIQNAHELSTILGCSSLSDEVAEREEGESDKRVEKINYLVPLLFAHSHALAEGAVEFQRSTLSPEVKGLPDEVWWESRKMMEQIAVSTLIGSVSQLVDMGLLEIPRKLKK
jgi:hypothetical protein